MRDFQTTSASTIKYLKPHFARYGIPKVVISDSGPQFTSEEFKKFASDYEFRHTTSSLRYPQSNGLEEQTVQNVKDILAKSMEDKSDPNLALVHLRNTPIEGIGMSSAQMLIERRTRTLLPTTPKFIKPMYGTDAIKPSLEERLDKQKVYYNRKPTNPLEPLRQGVTKSAYETEPEGYGLQQQCNTLPTSHDHTMWRIQERPPEGTNNNNNNRE